jgi:membrane protein YdbS with pleckstrin-like domain
MALINCPECGREVSREATACPQCGYPVAERLADAANTTRGVELLLEARPSWWNFFWYLVFFWLIVPLLIALWKRNSLVLRVYHDRVKLERGLLSKEYRELFINDIRSVDVDQGLLGRLCGFGDLTISTAATVDPAEIMPGLPHPLHIKDLIIAQRQKK